MEGLRRSERRSISKSIHQDIFCHASVHISELTQTKHHLTHTHTHTHTHGATTAKLSLPSCYRSDPDTLAGKGNWPLLLPGFKCWGFVFEELDEALTHFFSSGCLNFQKKSVPNSLKVQPSSTALCQSTVT